MIKKLSIALVFQFLLLHAFVSFSQIDNNSNFIVKDYTQNIASSSSLFNGSEYAMYDNGYSGHPFFGSKEFTPATIFYNGISYQNVPLLFDIVLNEIVIKDYTESYFIRLQSDRISSFSIADHHFSYMEALSPIMDAGFYEVLFLGKAEAYSKRKKIIITAKASSDNSSFIAADLFYIKVDTEIYSVASTSGLLKAFAKKKNEIKTFMVNNKINFKKDPESAILLTCQFYNSLTD